MQLEKGRLSIACVCMVLGFMLVIQFKSTEDIRASQPSQRVEELAARLYQAEAENKELEAEIRDLRGMSGDAKTEKITDDIMMISGMTPLEGPGVIITIDDSAKKAKMENDPNLYLVHDEDILKVVNELRAAGAEALSINGQRLTANSEIRCAGPTISVNNVRSAPPFEIRAIGDKDNLVNSINMRGGVADSLKVWGINLTIQPLDNVWIPAYKATTKYKLATTSSKEEETK
ncbi:MAG TPA: hypothetical protein DCR09_04530 [Anaerovibrio sp.]|uniref:DUF881 domain-containing protein n=1 Tax=Anaerovibrio lipolyticus TaxID=82374 RepID=UPI000E81E9A1|nr:DUF881 domain-containing protein [Anaerovibrio lipolyticus]MBE6106255.1 DUF881 domain-containing protein [Anaerovibrio lipolyticus]HAF31582.1 hypothetical protein [Anaerovibrio sp.]HAQ55629.1 hypothetical protein [Anaerovibrio sp.]HCP96046.1 hypothetical protein [Anaerovibrio sp.]